GLEDRIIDLENQLEAISRKLQHPPSDPAVIQQLGEDFAYLEAELQEQMDEWEKLHASLVEGISE
ncbi:MAG TPA: ABC transporter C-terminal domain-containing protein, partial [Anaerolineales bacterium]|nr:ABC transporter C-terminal domain-containing protein [Anaerolineales bacterium]